MENLSGLMVMKKCSIMILRCMNVFSMVGALNNINLGILIVGSGSLNFRYLQ